MVEETTNCPICGRPWDSDVPCQHLFAFAETSWPDGSGNGTPLDLTGVAWDEATELLVELSSLLDVWFTGRVQLDPPWSDRLVRLAKAVRAAAIEDDDGLIRDADSDLHAFRRYLGSLEPIEGMAETHWVLAKMPGFAESYTAFWSGQSADDARECTDLLREDLKSIQEEIDESGH